MRKLRKTGAVDPDVKVVTIPRLPSVTGVHKPPGRNRRSAAEKVEHLLGMSSTACTTTFLGLPTASTRAGLRQQVSLRIRSQLPTSGVPKLTIRPSAIAKWITHLEQILLRRQQQPRPGGDDLEQITRARQAAEALFRSKPPVSGPSVPASAPADQSARKPRVLQIISPAVPVRHEERKTPAAPEPQTMRKIPRSQFVRIRTLVKYGMTVGQVAEVYGVAAGEIARILRQA